MVGTLTRRLVDILKKNLLNVSCETLIRRCAAIKRKLKKKIEYYLYTYPKKLEENQSWNSIIEDQLEDLDELELKIIKMRYFDKKKIDYITFELFISRCKYFQMVDEILTEIAIDAAYHHLIYRGKELKNK